MDTRLPVGFPQSQADRAGSKLPFCAPLPVRNQQASFFSAGGTLAVDTRLPVGPFLRSENRTKRSPRSKLVRHSKRRRAGRSDQEVSQRQNGPTEGLAGREIGVGRVQEAIRLKGGMIPAEKGSSRKDNIKNLSIDVCSLLYYTSLYHNCINMINTVGPG